MFKKISQNFVKSPLNLCRISQVLVHSLWHVCIIGILWSFFNSVDPSQMQQKAESDQDHNYLQEVL